MSANYTDKSRLLSFKADGKTDFLFPASFTANERMSGLFNVRVDLMVDSEKADQVQGDQLLGKRMTLKVSHGREYDKGPYRFFDGVCCRFASTGKNDRFHLYEAELVPWMWLLTKRGLPRLSRPKRAGNRRVGTGGFASGLLRLQIRSPCQ